MRRQILFVLAISLFSSAVYSTTIHVPADQPTIQTGINVAVNGDTVLVADGHYYERISYNGKAIIVASGLLIDGDSLHIQNTIIDGDTTVIGISDTGSVVRFVNNEDSNSVLYGFTIRNGYGTLSDGKRLGGGIYCGHSSFRLEHCVISDNSAQEGGGIAAINSYSSAAVIINNCVISENIGSGFYGDRDSKVAFLKTIIKGNSDFGIRGSISNDITVTMDSCTVEGNIGGIFCRWGNISNSVISNNMGEGIYLSRYLFLSNYERQNKAKLRDDSTRQINNCIIENNTGYGIEFQSGWAHLEIVRSIIKGNGGAIRMGNDAYLDKIDSCQIIDNGSGIYANYSGEGGIGRITNCIFQNNVFAISATYNNQQIANCIFIGNTAGAIYFRGQGHDVANCTFINNASESRAAIYYINVWDSDYQASVDNCIFANNGSEGAIACSTPTDTNISISCTDIFGNSGGDWTGCFSDQANINGNFSANPMFCDTATGDYRLLDISPCAPANNGCAAIIGAYDVACQDNVPVITSADSVIALEGSSFVYKISFNDSDGPDTVMSFQNYPHWLSSDADSIFGSPAEGTPDTLFTVVISDGYRADTLQVFVDVRPVNYPPILDSIGPKGIAEGSILMFKVKAADPNNSIPVLLAQSLPDSAIFTDSGNGLGGFYWDVPYGQVGNHQVLFIASDGVFADSELVTITVNPAPPSVVAITIDNSFPAVHVLNHTPPINWDFFDPGNDNPQTQFEIAMGSDTDWTVAEMWNPAPFTGPDTSITYAGALLVDGGTYYLRLRVSNGILWSNWFNTSFRMNSVPSIPSIISPMNGMEIGLDDWLMWTESYDADMDDTVSYWLEIDDNPDFLSPEVSEIGITNFPEPPPKIKVGTSIVGIRINELTNQGNLKDDSAYHWRAKATDKFGGESEFSSENAYFFLNRTNSRPFPPIAGFWPCQEVVINNLLPTISWFPGSDPDSSDNGSVLHYEIRLDNDGEFALDYIYGYSMAPGITSFQLIDSLSDETKWYYIIRTVDDEGMVSDWSSMQSFWTNSHNDSPSIFQITQPGGLSVFDMKPTFAWEESIDSDPLDTVHYTLYIAIDSNFLFVRTIDSINQVSYQVTDSLWFGTKYWWKVKAVDKTGRFTYSNILNFRTWKLGDANGDWNLNALDVTFLINSLYKHGPKPNPLKVGDINGSCNTNALDITYLINYLYKNGNAPKVGCE